MDESKYKLGGLCKRGHDHEGTGKSLRYGSGRCRECIKEYQKEHYQANAEKIKDYNKNYLQTPEGKLVSKRKGHKRRALKVSSHIPFTSAQIRVRFDLFRDECAYCGSPDKITIYHINPISKNGMDAIENLAPACHRCNCSKNATPLDEWYPRQSFFSETRLQFIRNAMKPKVKKGRTSEAQQVRLF